MQTSKILNAVVLVTALGYLVDVYDILVFNVTRVASLTEIGLSGSAVTDTGLFILNMQLVGLILGGLCFGILADKFGRKQCLLGSILVYSFATIGCAFVQTLDMYAFLRFLAGFGLAGETGIGISLICEGMTKEKRTLGVTTFTFLGISGAVIAALFSEIFSWRTCYLIGGGAGLFLLFTRAMIMESGLYNKIKEKEEIVRGSIKMLITNKALMLKYVTCILVATPIWFTIGMVWTLAPEFAKSLGSVAPVKAPVAIGIGYSGMMIGDFICGLISYHFKNRKKVILGYLLGAATLMAALISWRGITATEYYIMCCALGLAIGYWVNFVSISAEQFGTNIRATVATSIPNFARASLLPMNLALTAMKPDLGFIPSIIILSIIAYLVAFWSLKNMEETFHKDMDFIEDYDTLVSREA